MAAAIRMAAAIQNRNPRKWVWSSRIYLLSIHIIFGVVSWGLEGCLAISDQICCTLYKSFKCCYPLDLWLFWARIWGLKFSSSFIYGDTGFPPYRPKTEGLQIQNWLNAATLKIHTARIWGLKVSSSFIYGDTEFSPDRPKTEGFQMQNCITVATLEMGTVQIWCLKVCSSFIYGDTGFSPYYPKTEGF